MSYSKEQRKQYNKRYGSRRGGNGVHGVDRLQYRAFRSYFEAAVRGGKSCELAFATALWWTRDERLAVLWASKSHLIDDWLAGRFGNSDVKKRAAGIEERYGGA